MAPSVSSGGRRRRGWLPTRGAAPPAWPPLCTWEGRSLETLGAHTHLRSFWLMKPSLSFSTALASMELASLAKSRSRISDTGTDTMAKASLSSLVGQVPSCKDRGQQPSPGLTPAHPAQPGSRTMRRMGRSSSTSMGTLVLWVHVLVHRWRSRT